MKIRRRTWKRWGQLGEKKNGKNYKLKVPKSKKKTKSKKKSKPKPQPKSKTKPEPKLKPESKLKPKENSEKIKKKLDGFLFQNTNYSTKKISVSQVLSILTFSPIAATIVPTILFFPLIAPIELPMFLLLGISTAILIFMGGYFGFTTRSDNLSDFQQAYNNKDATLFTRVHWDPHYYIKKLYFWLQLGPLVLQTVMMVLFGKMVFAFVLSFYVSSYLLFLCFDFLSTYTLYQSFSLNNFGELLYIARTSLPATLEAVLEELAVVLEPKRFELRKDFLEDTSLSIDQEVQAVDHLNNILTAQNLTISNTAVVKSKLLYDLVINEPRKFFPQLKQVFIDNDEVTYRTLVTGFETHLKVELQLTQLTFIKKVGRFFNRFFDILKNPLSVIVAVVTLFTTIPKLF